MHTRRSWAEPYKIKMVEHLRMTTFEQRQDAIADAGYNTFLLRSEDVYIDLLTDSGTNAMSDRQWAGIMLGDEAYSGSKNYFHLEDVVRRHYGYRNVIPTHQGRGAEHLLSQLRISPGDFVPGNMYFTTTKHHQQLAGGSFVDVIIDEAHDPVSEHPFKGNVDLAKMQRLIDEVGAERISYLSLETSVNMAGGQPCSMKNIKAICALCHEHSIAVYLDATRAVENAYFIKEREPGYEHASIAEILWNICACTDGCTMSAKKDALVNIGGFLALNDDELAERARNLCVVYEGLHTYGGLAGRDLEAMAIGIEESVDFDHVRARIGQVRYLGERLRDAGVPIVNPIGGHGVFIDASRFLPHLPREQFPSQALSAALYVESGVRSMERGAVSAGRDPETGQNVYPALELVRLTLPRRVYTQAHMDVVAESIIDLHAEPERIVGLEMTYEPEHLRFFQARFKPTVGSVVLRPSGAQTPEAARAAPMKTIIEPFRMKTVDPIRMSTRPQRREQLERAGFNLFRIPAEHVIIDLLTDSGTGAMSSRQWAGIMCGDESYAGASSYYRFHDTVHDLTGFDNILPTHQGRASERLLVEAMIGSGDAGRGRIVPNNAHFDTTRANIEHSGADAVDLLTEAGREPTVAGPFKGDMDVRHLEQLLGERTNDVPFVMVTITCNSNGGQPVSLANLQAVRAVCDRYGKPLILDAARFAENAWFIKQREPEHRDRSVVDIVRDTFDLCDGATISAKKDGLVNIGGVLLLRDKAAFERASNLLILTEGFMTYGGLAGRDLEAMATGFVEVLDEDYLRYRVRSVEYLGEKLLEGGISIVQPPGGHAVYIDAAAFCPHLERSALPGQALACALYEHGGIRTCEIGTVMLGEHAVGELVRLALPRRTYTQAHIDYVIEVLLELETVATTIPGLAIVAQPQVLRHFSAHFAPLSRAECA